MLVGDVFLDKRCGLEEFLTCLTSELAFVFLLNVRLNGLCQFPGNIRNIISPGQCELITGLLIVMFPSIVARVYSITINQQSDLGVKPLKPALICK